MKKNLSHIFAKFVGREIKQSPNLIDPVIAEIRDLAKKEGYSLRVWFPGQAGTADMRINRLNIHVAKEADGKYRIQNKFDLG